MIAAIVLAAGRSERMGRPKALLPFRGRTFLENILASVSKASIEHTVVVLGGYREQIERTIPLAAAVFNADYEQGMITSFQTGIRALPPGSAGAVLFLVDNPLVQPVTTDALVERFQANRIIIPTFQGRRGHPVLFASEILEEILALPSSVGANTILARDPARVIEVPLNAPEVLADIDTPEQYQELLEGDFSGGG